MIIVSRVKINLANGSSVDKPIVSAFKGTNGDYVILDNETNGSMGLPIICVSKINNDELVKVSDPAEWSAIKENLKSIIAGTNLPYITIPEVLKANEDFYTQLTLPVPSFDLLKNVYAPAPAATADTPVVETPIAPVEIPDPVPNVSQPNVIGTPVMPDVPTAPVMPDASSAPVMPDASSAPDMSMPAMPVIPNITPVYLSSPELDADSINYEEIKANFMSACETMIDGLIEKLKK